MTNEHTADNGRASILDQIEELRNEFHLRRDAQPPPTTSLQSAYEIRMQRLYDRLDSVDPTSS